MSINNHDSIDQAFVLMEQNSINGLCGSVWTSNMIEQKYSTVGIAYASAYASGIYYLAGKESGTSSLTTYDSNLSGLIPELNDGGYVVDKRSCSIATVVSYMSVSNNPKLKEDEYVPIGTWPEVAEKASEYFSVLTPEEIKNQASSLSPKLYADMWHKLGAMVGQRVGQNIVWRHVEGLVTPIFSEKDLKMFEEPHVGFRDPWLPIELTAAEKRY